MGYIEEAKQEIAKIEKTSRDLYEMARIEEVGSIFYFLASRNEHNPPHFHFEKKQGKKAIEGRILFEAPEYYKSEKMKATLTPKEAEELYELFLKRAPNDRFGRAYWEKSIDLWNDLPGVRKLPIDLPLPDYRKLQ